MNFGEYWQVYTRWPDEYNVGLPDSPPVSECVEQVQAEATGTGPLLVKLWMVSSEVPPLGDFLTALARVAQQRPGNTEVSLLLRGDPPVEAVAAALHRLGQLATWVQSLTVAVQEPSETTQAFVKLAAAMQPDAAMALGPGLFSLDVLAPLEVLHVLLDVLVVVPSALEHLQVSSFLAIQGALRLPAGLVSLTKLTVDLLLVTKLQGLARPLDKLNIHVRSNGVASLDALDIPGLCSETDLTVEAPHPLNLDGPLRTIIYLDKKDVSEAAGWRCRHLSVKWPLAVSVHCHAMVVTYANVLRVTGASKLLVVRQKGYGPGWNMGDIPTCPAWVHREHPTVQAVQRDFAGAELQTMFLNDRLPATLPGLIRLAVALGIANGDGEALIKVMVGAALTTLSTALITGRLAGDCVFALAEALFRQIVYEVCGQVRAWGGPAP